MSRTEQRRAILRARDYKALFPCHPLSQIYPSSTNLHHLFQPPFAAYLVLLCIFNSQLCNQPCLTPTSNVSPATVLPFSPGFSRTLTFRFHWPTLDPIHGCRRRRRPSSTIISPRKSGPPRLGNRFAFIRSLE